jgi:PII-like signaling protein
MELTGEAKLLRIFLGEDDKVGHGALFEVIVKEARAAGLAGATVWKGVLGFGATSRVRTASILDLSSDLPVVVEIVDEERKIDAFLPTLHTLFEKADSGGLVTLEKVRILKYLHGNKKKGK